MLVIFGLVSDIIYGICVKDGCQIFSWLSVLGLMNKVLILAIAKLKSIFGWMMEISGGQASYWVLMQYINTYMLLLKESLWGLFWHLRSWCIGANFPQSSTLTFWGLHQYFMFWCIFLNRLPSKVTGGTMQCIIFLKF